MDLVPPSYQSATTRDAWSFIATYIPSSDLCAATLVCRKWHALFMPFLWGDPASHFGTDNDAVYVALTRFRRTLVYARLEVRMLTHTLHLPPALSEIYGGPRPEWLREILEYLPCLQSLIVSKLPFFDHNSMVALRNNTSRELVNETVLTYNVRLLLADHEPNTTSQGLAEALLRFQELVYLDLSYTTPTRDSSVLSALSQLEHLQVLKLRGIGLRDSDAEFLANAIGLRVRYLDLRDNRLTDMAIRSLLQASFLSPGNPAVDHGSDVGTAAPGPFTPATSPPTNSKWLSCPTLDEQFMKALTQPLTGRSWVENVPHAGITHLYIADNRITVEGVASLIASYRLHALDVGTVDTADSIRDSRVISSYHKDPRKLPGAEKLIPILGSAAKENLTYLRAHHAVCTADAPWKDPVSSNGFVAELPAESEDQTPELDAANVIHELPAEEAPVFELPGSPVPETWRTDFQRSGHDTQAPIREDEPLPLRRRGSVFAPEVVETPYTRADDDATSITISPLYPAQAQEGLIPTELEFDENTETPGTVPRCTSPVVMDDPKTQKIQELISKRPKNSVLPRKDYKENSFPYLHPSFVPHLETLVLTDVPSHVPANSPILRALIRFITACSNEALLATLQAGSDYSLPPGRARAKAEQERSRSLFALRRLVLEVTPVERTTAKLTAWKSTSYQQGASKSSTGDRDLEKLWSAAADDFSFFGEDECGVPNHDPGRYFPMAALNEKVILIPEEDDSGNSGYSTPVASAQKLHRPDFPSSYGSHSRPSSINSGPARNDGAVVSPQADAPEVDLISELAAFRRSKKAEYEDLVRRDRKRRSTVGTTPSLLSPSGSLSSFGPLSPSPSLSTVAAVSAPQLAMSHYVEGYWKGEVKIVRNPAPKGRSGVVDMYGNYFEKGYLYP
ncbi:Leucine Rich Repeat domain protein [Aspergillus bombycis]|uniref:Leucine Rich Repeat domain protein n=1 Tax=Aspergillus bombycis TaxID=109264 RepID=A0A1F7ZUC2_9EURO|nr:Leucine Rich Repeat domain protein [Aspergillus bombycis]OGM42879.1 Leucine Rich Repeat domain protein [Aspergillus bombycis]